MLSRLFFIIFMNMVRGKPIMLFISISLLYFIIQFLDLAYIFSLLMLIYEFGLNMFILFNDYFFNIFKYSILYLFIYFLICLFNIKYLGYYKFKFFGLDLSNYKIV